jgi:quercetin dioxygenase-like cupin family protein
MKRMWILVALLPVVTFAAPKKYLFPHSECKEFAMYGNQYKGIATKTMGSDSFEIWQTTLAVGSKTPKHSHETQEVFVLLKGEILATIGDQDIHCVAPCTLVCPAQIPHQLTNVGKEPTEQIVVLGIDSKIFDLAGKEMALPWR